MRNGATGLMDDSAIGAIIADQGLPKSYRAIVADYWQPIASRIAAVQRSAGRAIVVGINGSQGSGKSTFCLFAEKLLQQQHGLHTATLSIDDLYLGLAQRRVLADAVHPLFAVRGVPGTHDVALGLRTIDGLTRKTGQLRVPRFDKASDDRVAAEACPIITTPVDVVLFEGWCVAAAPEDTAALAAPINALEEDEDAAGVWRRHANDRLGDDYRALFAPIDLLIMLQPPGFEVVTGWRQLQERKLRARAGQGMNDAEVARFVMHYERLTRHILATMPARANIVVSIDAAHQVTRLVERS